MSKSDNEVSLTVLYVYVDTSLLKCTESDKEVSLTLNVHFSPLTQDSAFSIAEQIKYICVGCLLVVRIYVQGCLLKYYIHFFVGEHYILQMWQIPDIKQCKSVYFSS